MPNHDWRRQVRPDYVSDARINELVGLASGVIADGVVTQEEAAFLQGWLRRNQMLIDKWPCNVLYPRIGAMLADDSLDSEEERELLALLADFTSIDASGVAPTYLPVNNPMPPLRFAGANYVLTGTFECGSRAAVRKRLEALGAVHKGSFSNQVDFLVIGKLVTPAWAHSNYGRKIEAAATAREGGHRVAIVTESHLVAHW